MVSLEGDTGQGPRGTKLTTGTDITGGDRAGGYEVEEKTLVSLS